MVGWSPQGGDRLRKLACTAGALSAVLGLSACGPVKLHPYDLAAGQEGAKGVHAILLLPLNLVTSLPEELDYPSQRVAAEIVRYLEGLGRKVDRVRLFEARALLASLEKADPPDPDATRLRFLERLRKDRSFDVVVMPDLVYRKAHVRAVTHKVEWDGVQRTLDLRNPYQHKLSVRYTADVAGDMPGVSLHVLVYGADGQRIFDSYGGIDIVHEAEPYETGQTGAYQLRWRLKRHRLEDLDAIREGVRLAFDPYLSPASPSANAAP